MLGHVRRVATARLRALADKGADADVDDVVQETAARLWDVRWRLEPGALLGYGMAVARNLVTSIERVWSFPSCASMVLSDPSSSFCLSFSFLRVS